MFVRGISLSVAALLAIGMLSAAAGAGQNSPPPPPPPEDESSGLPLLRHIPGFRILFGDDAVQQENSDRPKGNASGFDESYYEPQPATPPKQKKKAAVTPKASTEGAASTAEGTDTGTAKATMPEKTAAATPKPPADGKSCGKAAEVISGYGFSDVTPASCNGKVYAFNAKRDGKSFAIKFNPASGELAEVKKLP